MATSPRPWWTDLRGTSPVTKQKRRAGLSVLAIAAAAAASVLSQLPAWQLLESRAFDHLSMIAPPPRPAGTPLVVAIDEPSFAEVAQQWPWSRNIHARLVTALRDAEARTIALDLVFADPSVPEADAALAAAVGPDTVLAADERVLETPQAIQLLRTDPLPALLEAGAVAGVSTIPLDRDGTVRRFPQQPDSLSGALLERRDLAVPVAPPEALIQFYGPARSTPTVSYYQALDPDAFLPPGFFAGRDVIVGFSLQAAPTADQGGGDAFTTPATVRSGSLVAGAEIHATLAANLAAGDWIRPVSLSPRIGANVLTAMLAMALLSLGARRWQILSLVLGLALLPLACWLALRLGRLWFPPLAPMAAFAVTAAGQTLRDFAAERRLRAGLTRAFAHYLSPALVERLAADPGALRLGGESREITVLFCDIRGFTTLAEGLQAQPERLTMILHRLMEPLSQAVLAENGTIDKYIGDCLMAFWNAPLDVPDHAARAVAAGRRMIAALAILNDDFAREGIAPLSIGIGINTGTCIVGNMGSGTRFDYSAIGDAVNLAARLEGMTKDMGVPLVVGEATAAAIGRDGGLRPLADVNVRGRTRATRVFTLA
ncbi:CHASE2 domain-containing protein [Paracoccus aerius]|uniref:Adenylate/guanylate cyclase domain-containing protein n=1 Tax=Paracoccus aerius TaxID=1915382 RepID=A0ABS1S8Z3_9RHOB|nr:adenylate/guanylate cyclase domain-containing protein [Paracoccus aerius]MBL3675207.1 adenylate/guanylate cyclase domain-containing protein [Paracoccus aerius]GHG31295.1 adenylate/guanylate cyclase domain-containing protein [Paracoccus aerius]